MQHRWVIGCTCALAALLVLGGCEMFATAPANLADGSREECIVLTTVLDKIVNDWRTNPQKQQLQVDAYAISADKIDSDYDSKLSGLPAAKNARPVDVANCGTFLAPIATSISVVWPSHPMPTGDRHSCWRSDGGWISRAAIDAERMHAAVLYTDDICGDRYWLVRLRKDSRGIWYADAPGRMHRLAVLPAQSD